MNFGTRSYKLYTLIVILVQKAAGYIWNAFWKPAPKQPLSLLPADSETANADLFLESVYMGFYVLGQGRIILSVASPRQVIKSNAL